MPRTRHACDLWAWHDGVFSIAHLDDYPAILVQLDIVDPGVLDELITDAWLAKAPESLTRTYLADHTDD